MFCNDEQTGGITVQTIDTPESERLVFLLEIPHHSVCQCVFVIPLGGMHRCIRRFVRDQQVFIFVDNTKRNGSRGNRVGALFREKNGQKVSRFWFLIGVCPGVVQADTVDRAFQMGEDVMGISSVSQVLFDGLLFVTWLDGIFKNSFHMCSFLRVLPGISRSGSNGVFRRKQV